jgi:hypothetical protein
MSKKPEGPDAPKDTRDMVAEAGSFLAQFKNNGPTKS